MKFRGLIFWLAGVLLLAACARTPAAITPVPVQSSPLPQEATAPYPLPTLPPNPAPGAYPPAVPAAAAETGPLYPDLAEGAQVSWFQASALVMNQEVTKILQTHDKKVYLTLKDGRTVFTTEGEIDQIMQVIKQCGEPCSTIEVATE